MLTTYHFKLMKLTSILITGFLLSASNIFGQIRTLTGKVISDKLEVIPEVRIQNSDTILFATTDISGKFKIEIPVKTKSLLFNWVGFEWKAINLTDNCIHLDVILMERSTYDYMSLRKVDRLRMKRFKKLPELHRTAYKKDIFITEQPCYEQVFQSTRRYVKR